MVLKKQENQTQVNKRHKKKYINLKNQVLHIKETHHELETLKREEENISKSKVGIIIENEN